MAIALQRDKLASLLLKAYNEMPEMADKRDRADSVAANQASVAGGASNQYTKMTIDELRREVEAINNDLTELGEGAAFKWLSKPDTGYKEYVELLLAVRRKLRKGSVLNDAEQTEAPLLVAELKEKADAVRTSVGVSQKLDAEDGDVAAPEAESVAAEGKVENEVKIQMRTEAPVSHQEGGTKGSNETAENNVNISVVDSPQKVAEVPAKITEETKEEGVDLAAKDTDGDPLNVLPVKDEISHVDSRVEGGMQKAKIDVETAEPVVEETIAEPQTSNTDAALMTKEVTGELNKLLTEWLGGGGFLGMGKSGLEHPDFVATKDLLIADLIAGDLPVGARLNKDTLASIKANILEWRKTYGMYPEDNERFEHFLRRVIVAGSSH